MKSLIMALMCLAFGIAISGCTGGVGAASTQSLPIPDQTTSVTLGDARIGALDLVQVEIFGVESLNGTYQVSFDGQMKLPLIGEIDAIGMTAGELAYELEEIYGSRYLQDPDVSVSIVESTGRRVTLEGAIRSPGIYPITGTMTLVQAVALGGGPAQDANARKVVVFRQIDGERHAAAFDLVAIRNGNREDPAIYGNDIIIVDGSNINEAYQATIRTVPLLALFLAF